MNLGEFKQRLRREAPATIDASVLEAVADSYGEREFYSKNLGEAIELAGRLQANGLGIVTDKGKLSAFVPSSRENIDSDIICDALEPRIIAIRQRFFDSAAPPFPGTKEDPLAELRKIDDWIKARTIVSTSQEPYNEKEQFRLTLELGRLTRSNVSVSKPYIEYPRWNEKNQKWESTAVAIDVDSPLVEMAREIQFLKSGGFSATSLTAWIFSGIRPLIPRISVWTGFSAFGGFKAARIPGMPEQRWFCTITINAGDVTWKELWQVYRTIRKTPRVTRGKVNPLHARIYQIVRERGAPPSRHGQKSKFWKSIQAQLKREKQFARIPGSWEGIRKAYVTAVRKGDDNGRQRSKKRK